jgi:two-component system response regulator VicR
MANATILVVDDDREIVKLVALCLKRDGYRVLLAYDGQQAIELARRCQPDLMLLDVLLPCMDGLQVCRVLRAESADDYVTKPLSMRELLARIRAVLRRTMRTRVSGPLEMALTA